MILKSDGVLLVGVPTLSRVVWSEGMFLAQHHFQAQSRYFENAIYFALSSLFSGPYGFLRVELDEDALWNGTVSLLAARGVMPDGLPFDLGDAEPLPPKRTIGDILGTSAQGQILHLAIPTLRQRHANCASTSEMANGAVRYRAQDVDVFDETTGDDRRTVPVGVKNFALLLESERTEDHEVLPIGVVRADGSGHYISDPDFIPTCLQIDASPRLLAMLGRMIEMLEAKAGALARRHVGHGHRLSEVATHELTSYWLIHALNSSLGPLRHHFASGRGHPQRLYEDLVRLAGSLCTFSVGSRIDEIPLYDHARPTDVFGELERHIRRHLDVVIRESHVSVPLARTANNLYAAPLTDPRTLGGEVWILRISCSARDSVVIDEVRRKVKVASAEDVMRLVAEQVPGLAMEHLPTPPSNISARIGSHYFRLKREGFAWDLISARSSVGAYVPDSLPDAEVELLALVS